MCAKPVRVTGRKEGMIEQESTIRVKVAQTKDVCAVGMRWERPTTPPPDSLPAGATWMPFPRTWEADGSSKRSRADKSDMDKGANLATLRALRKLVRRLERQVGPDAFDLCAEAVVDMIQGAPREEAAKAECAESIPETPDVRAKRAMVDLRAALAEMYGDGTIPYRKALASLGGLVAVWHGESAS